MLYATDEGALPSSPTKLTGETMAVRAIAAIDSERGFATDEGIPWKLPADHKYYLDTVRGGIVLMGYQTYLNHDYKIHHREEYVLTSRSEVLRPGFIAVNSLDKFIKNQREDIWALGGQNLFEQIVPQADELYLTQVNGNFDCTRHFPAYKHLFRLAWTSEQMQENGIDFQYQIWENDKGE